MLNYQRFNKNKQWKINKSNYKIISHQPLLHRIMLSW